MRVPAGWAWPPFSWRRPRVRAIIATAGSETKRALLRGLGIEHVLDFTQPRFSEEHIHAGNHAGARGGCGPEFVGGRFHRAGAHCLAPVVVPGVGKRDIWTPERFTGYAPRRYYAIDLAAMRCHDPIAWLRLFADVIDAAARGDLRALPMRLFPLERAADAFRCMAQARHIGKIVLTQCDDRINWPDELSPDATYLITGGLWGLGLATAEHLVAKGARHVVLVGRRPVGIANEANLAALRAWGRRSA